MKRQNRPVRSSSYQGSYIELPFNHKDDDAYDDVRLYLGPYTSTAKNQRNSLIARESEGQQSNSQKAEEKKEKIIKKEECAAAAAFSVTLVRQTLFPQSSSCASSSLINFEDIGEEEEEVEEKLSFYEDIPDLIKAEFMGDMGQIQSRSSTQSEEIIPNLDKIINDSEIEQGEKDVDKDRLMMPPPPLPWVKLKHSKLDECKFTPVLKPSVKDWNSHLISMYGSIKNAHDKPWMSDHEKEALNLLGQNSKMLDRFSVQNWEFAPDNIKDSHEESPLFKLPTEEGLDKEICKKLQYVRDILNLYRSLRFKENSGHLKRPIFLPFLKRNLRYNNYIPIDGNEPSPLKEIQTREKTPQPKFLELHPLSSNKPKANTTKNEKFHSHTVHDLSIKLLSVKHKMLPSGHKASVTFFYALYNFITNDFSTINKVDSSTFTVDVGENLIPVNIDLPSELEFKEDQPYEIFIVLRVLFFDPSQDTYCGGKSLRNVPARLAGQCERAREAEELSRKGSQKVREPREGDTVMYGAFQVSKKIKDKWEFIVGQTSLILVESEKLDIEFDDKKWQRSKKIIENMIQIGMRNHTNPFVYIEINSVEEDDNSTLSNVKGKKLWKLKEKIQNQPQIDSVKEEEELNSKFEFDLPLPPKQQISKYDLPPAIVYQLSLDFIYKDMSIEESQPHRVIAGFNTIVTDKPGRINENVIKPERIKGKPAIKKQYQQTNSITNSNNSVEPLKGVASSHRSELATALSIMDQKAPPPRLFTYCASQSPGYCIFCEIKHKNLFSLMWHYRTCHSRFTYVYRNAIEYKPGHYLPGFVLSIAPTHEDIYWHQRKKVIFHCYKKAWPHQFRMDRGFFTPCNTLMRKITDGIQDIPPLMTTKHLFNRYGSRPLDYQHTQYGRLIKPMPDWMIVKMKRDLNDIVDLDPHEVTFMMEWNKFLFLYGPITGKETNVYKLCRSFVEQRRKEIVDLHLEIPTVTLMVYFVQNKILSPDEMYDIIMRLQTNYDPFTDILHPLSINERRRAKRHIQKEEALAERLRRKRPKKHYEPTSISLRRRLDDSHNSDDDDGDEEEDDDDPRSRDGSIEVFDEGSPSSSSTTTDVPADSPSSDDIMCYENEA